MNIKSYIFELGESFVPPMSLKKFARLVPVILIISVTLATLFTLFPHHH